MQNKMKFLKNIFAFIAVAAAALGCSGTVDESTLPVLKAGDTEIDLATESGTELTVTYSGRDVTSDSDFFVNGKSIPGNFFTPEGEGVYTICAVYSGITSNEVEVSVVNTNQKVESKYERHVNIIEFTGAWCINCPKGYTEMMGKLSLPSMSKYREFIHLCAFHDNTGGKDVMAIPATQDVFKLFKGLAYPSFVTDLRNVEGNFGNLTESGISNVQSSVLASFNDYPAHCGVAVSSTLNESGTEASVTVKVASELTSEYRVLLLVVEDKVLAPETPQKTPMFSEGDPDYIHKHVVRKVATSYSGTFTGEKITSDGKISSGEEASKTWTVAVDSSWKPEDTEIYALVLDSTGSVNNMNVCGLDNGNSDYNLKK